MAKNGIEIERVGLTGLPGSGSTPGSTPGLTPVFEPGSTPVAGVDPEMKPGSTPGQFSKISTENPTK